MGEVKGSCMEIKETSGNDDNNTLLQLQTLQVASCRKKGVKKRVVGFWDPGSTLSFRTFDLASELSLQGRPAELEIVIVRGVTKKVNSRKYNLSEASQACKGLAHRSVDWAVSQCRITRS